MIICVEFLKPDLFRPCSKDSSPRFGMVWSYLAELKSSRPSLDKVVVLRILPLDVVFSGVYGVSGRAVQDVHDVHMKIETWNHPKMKGQPIGVCHKSGQKSAI